MFRRPIPALAAAAAMPPVPVRARRWAGRLAIGVAAALALGALGLGTAAVLGMRKLDRVVELPALADSALSIDASSRERGRYLYASRGCADCHGSDGAGRLFVDDPKAGLSLKAPDITAGGPATIARYSDADWQRLLRHGVKPDGRAAFVMPSEDYARFTDADLGAIVAHVRSLPAVRGPSLASSGAAELSIPFTMLAAYGAGLVKDAAEKIDHHARPAAPVARAVTAEHGAYVAQMCVGCHGRALEGGRIAGGPPDWPPAARLAPGEANVMPRYPRAEDFMAMLRSGRRPDGSAIAVMPFESLRELDDVDSQALHLYLTSSMSR